MDIVSIILGLFGGLSSFFSVMSTVVQALVALWGVIGPLITSLLV